MSAVNRLQVAYDKARADLIAQRTPRGHWVGELSTSALSTATALSALSLVSHQMRNATGDSVTGDSVTGDGGPEISRDKMEVGGTLIGAFQTFRRPCW